MNGYNFTDRVRKVLQIAREEATRLHHEYVGTEHILLGILGEGHGVASAALANLNIGSEEITTTIYETVKQGTYNVAGRTSRIPPARRRSSSSR
jgi:ATP-dependent Clp protease ATP-binding subunit ClpC